MWTPEQVVKVSVKSRQDNPVRRRFRPSFLGVAGLGCLLVSGACRLDMQDQPRYEPLEKSDFFGDQRSARPLVEGSVARGQLRVNEHLYQGKISGEFSDTLPFPLTRQVLERGRERYNIYCSPCHDDSGSGEGIIVRRGLRRPPSLHIDRLRQQRLGYFFDVMTNGFGAMYSYASRIKPEDRWAIAAYLRALQLSQNATLADVPAEMQSQLQGTN